LPGEGVGVGRGRRHDCIDAGQLRLDRVSHVAHSVPFSCSASPAFYDIWHIDKVAAP
jgi:hypothetical protein